MGLTITWSIVRSLITLVLAALFVSRSNSRFEAAAFVAALIAYHRIGFAIEGLTMGGLARGMRAELWFRRLDYLGRRGEDGLQLPPVLEVGINDDFRRRPDLFGEWEELENLKSDVAELESQRNVRFYVVAVVEVILMVLLTALLLTNA